MPNKPLAPLPERLKKRSQLLHAVRAFFYARKVTEVDTPILSTSSVPDVHLHSLSTQVQVPGEAEKQVFYLHTSPEYAMKRLLSLGCGDLFSLGKVFRDGDLSPRHQVEFTMLEWYRIGFSMFDLMDEVAELIQTVLGEARKVERLSYRQAFAKYAGIEDIFSVASEACRNCLQQHSVPEVIGVDPDDKALWEQLVMTEVIEPQLGRGSVTLIYHYPARDAALARISPEDSAVAERFEAFVEGMELANGYHELADAALYRERFNASLKQRAQAELPGVPLDENLLETLTNHPLPDCSGVALGFDRLFALQQGFNDIEDGIPFGLKDA